MTVPETADYEIVTVQPGIGHTLWLIRCRTCGQEKWIFVWSFAGHGKTECMGCHKWISYLDKRGD